MTSPTVDLAPPDASTGEPRERRVADQPTIDAPPLAADRLPSGGALEIRRLQDAIEATLFERAPEPVQIARFTILDRLGAGGMGVVYGAYDPGLDRKVAVKVLRRDDRPEARRGLVEEARALARLSHPNIITVHEVGEHQGQVFVAMELIDGQSLDHWIVAGDEPQPWPEVLEVFARAGQGLAAAHAAGLVHRDFKPHNVMRSRDGAVKVLDFGLARPMPGQESAAAHVTGPQTHGTDSGSATHTGALVGTPAYMAPEQLSGTRATARSDQFSFCVAMFEALHGQRPFPGTSLEQIAFSVLEGQIETPAAGPRIPAWVRAVLERGLSTDPEARFESMAQLLAALRRDPAVRRRRLFGGALAVGAGLVGGAGLFGGDDVIAAAAADACAAAGSAIASAWSPARRDTVREGMLSTGGPRAAATWNRVAPQLDAYADEWSTAATQACRAHEDGQESAQSFDRRTACLRTQRSSLEAVTELLEHADAELVDHAPATVAALPSVLACDAVDDPSTATRVPGDPEAAEAVASGREQLARARVLEHAGQYESAQQLAQAVAAQAEALAFAPLSAEAAVVLGSVAMFVEPPEVADTTLGTALAAAVAVGHDGVALEALAKRAFVRADLLRTPTRALDDEAHADALLQRHRQAEPRLRWLVANNLGVVRELAGDLPAATERYSVALANAEARGDRGRLDAMAVLTNLTYLAFRQTELGTAEEHARRALEVGEAALGPEHPQLPFPLHALGDVLIAGGRDAEATEVLLRSVTILELRSDPPSPMIVVDLHSLARVALRRRQFASALASASRAAKLAREQLGDTHALTVSMMHLHGDALIAAGRSSEGIEIHREALTLALAGASDPSASHAALGSALGDSGDLEGAAQQLALALVVLAQSPDLPDDASLPTLRLQARTAMQRGELDTVALAVDTAVPIAAQTPQTGNAIAWARTAAALAMAQGAHADAVDVLEAVLRRVQPNHDADDPDLAALRFELAQATTAASGSTPPRARTLATHAASAYLQLGPAFDAERAAIDAWLGGA